VDAAVCELVGTMLKIATVVALLGVALAGVAEAKTKIINPWNSFSGNIKTCPDLAGRWPYCDIFFEPRVVIVVPGHDKDGHFGHNSRAEEFGAWTPRRYDYRRHDGSP
jgi:hypothetical protein